MPHSARASGTAIFLLSATHYAEMLKIKDPDQRRTIADVMEGLTEFSTIISRVVVMELELAAVLDEVSKSPNPFSVIPLLGRGVRHAFGIQSGVRFTGRDGDATDRVRTRMGAEAFDDFVAKANLMLERSVLRGPTDDQVEELRRFGWNPAGPMQVTENRAAEERAQTRRLDGEGPWRRSRLRDVVSAREILIEFQDILPRALAERGLSLESLIALHPCGRDFIRAMPSTEVSMALKAAWHRNRNKPWIQNDIHDIDGMSLAVPYCDVVVTEKACHHALTAESLDKRMGTALLRNLHELRNVLARWRPQRPQKGSRNDASAQS